MAKTTPRTTEFSTATPNYSSRDLLRDLLTWLRPYRKGFIAASFSRFGADVVALFPSFALAKIVTILATGNASQSLDEIWTLLGLMAAVFLIRPIAQSAAKLTGYRIAERIALDAQLETLSHLSKLDMSWHEKENAGNKMRRVQRGGESINRIMRIWIMRVIEMSVNFVGMTIILATFDITVAIVILIFITTYFTISYAMVRRASRMAHLVNVQDEHVSGLAFETINNIRTVKVLGMFRALREILVDSMDELNSRIRRRIFWFQTRHVILEIWANLFRIGLYSYIIFGIVQGRFEIGFLVLFTGYFIRLWIASSELAESTQEFIISKYGIARMQDILHEPLSIDAEEGKRAFPNDWKEMRVENLSFSYGTVPALRNISFTLQRGERIGIIGLSGAGKSTLMKLLLKENEDYTGEILFDGVPLRTVKRSTYFQHAAAVLQDTELFNLTLRENVSLVVPEAQDDDERFMEAIQAAHVTDFLEKLPNGADTIVGEKGIKLSGGEKQRVGLARAIFKRPEILFLDEATSHLDLESEQKIQDALAHLLSRVTAIVIAHRLTTIREMDRILVIEDGRLIEDGTFDELMARSGRFRELWDMQKI